MVLYTMDSASTDIEHACAVCETRFDSAAELEEHVHDAGLIG